MENCKKRHCKKRHTIVCKCRILKFEGKQVVELLKKSNQTQKIELKNYFLTYFLNVSQRHCLQDHAISPGKDDLYKHTSLSS